MKVFLDDRRATPVGWVRTYTVEETLDMLKTRQVQVLSLDNDLGEGLQEGYKVMDTLEEWIYLDPTFPIPVMMVHSSNPARRGYMNQIINKLDLIRQQQIGGE
jgi:hypothetical protein